MDLEQRREAIRLTFRRERVAAALAAVAAGYRSHQDPAADAKPITLTIPALEPVGAMSARAAEVLFGY